MTLDLKRFERFKDEYLAKLTSSTIREAMIYSLDGGKRFRARLIFALLKTRSIDEKRGYHCALALEMIHAYSLIHDDLRRDSLFLPQGMHIKRADNTV